MVLEAHVQVQADMVILGAKEIKDAKLNQSRQGLAEPQRGKEIYFLSVKHRVLEKRERKKDSSHTWVHYPQMVTTAMTGPDQGQERGVSSGSSTWMAEVQVPRKHLLPHVQ